MIQYCLDKTCPKNDTCIRYTTDPYLAKTNINVIYVNKTLRKDDELLCERYIKHLPTIEEFYRASNNKIKF
jgi:hypothetical protein